MYAGICPSEDARQGSVPAYVRATGAVQAQFSVGKRGTRVVSLSESGGFRLKFPDQVRDECEAVMVNTGGGLTGGDRFSLHVEANDAARAVLTTQSAEKIYRSNGPQTRVETRLMLAPRSALAFLPQETILFSGARLQRVLNVEMDEAATLLAAESVVFGRTAMGEVLEAGSFRDRWRIRRGGALIFAEDVRLEGAIAETLKRKAVGDGARAAATILYAAPDAETRLEAVREQLDAARCEAGAACFDRLMIVRLLAKDAAVLRRDLAGCLTLLRGAALPRVWQC